MSPKITNKRAVLLTGTIVPNSIYTHYNDPHIRLKEYIYAIKFYCYAFKEDDIYFLENSDFDLDNNPLFIQCKRECSFTVLRFPRSERFNEGKGYQEFEMVDGAVTKLKDSYNSFIKITGRYIVKNALELTDHICDGITIDLYTHEDKADTFFIYFSSEFYMKYLLGEYKNVKDHEGYFIEKVIYKKIKDLSLFDQSRLFPKTTQLEGITGSYGIVMKRNPVKVMIRNMERIVYNLMGIKTFFR